MLPRCWLRYIFLCISLVCCSGVVSIDLTRVIQSSTLDSHHDREGKMLTRNSLEINARAEMSPTVLVRRSVSSQEGLPMPQKITVAPQKMQVGVDSAARKTGVTESPEFPVDMEQRHP